MQIHLQEIREEVKKTLQPYKLSFYFSNADKLDSISDPAYSRDLVPNQLLLFIGNEYKLQLKEHLLPMFWNCGPSASWGIF